MQYYNPSYPTSFPAAPYSTHPAEHNVYISNYFIGNTTLEAGGGYPSIYPSPPPPPYSETDPHNSYLSPQEKAHYDKFDPLYPQSDKGQFESCSEKTGDPQTPEQSKSGASFRDTMFGPETQFDVWKNAKEEPVDLPAHSSCVYSNNVVKSEETMPRLLPIPIRSDYEDRKELSTHYEDRKDNQIGAFNATPQIAHQGYNYNNHQEASLVDQIQEAHLQGNHKGVMEMIATNCFSPKHHDTLQELWLSAVYGFAKLRRGKPPNAVDRYRLRKKYPFPATVWDGERTLYCYKQSSRDQLEDFYNNNKYPTPLEKKELSERCDLSYMQVCNWFKNKRMRGKEQVCRQQRGS